jgi:hypothetical protein
MSQQTRRCFLYQIIITERKAVIKKVVRIKNTDDKDMISDDLKYWTGKSPEERVATVDYLRKQFHGNSERLQRVVRVVQRS